MSLFCRIRMSLWADWVYSGCDTAPCMLELRSMMLRFACSFLQVICVIVDLPPLVLQRVVLSWNQYIGPLATAHDNGEDQLKSSPHPLFQPSLSSSPSPKSSIPFSIVKSPSLSTA
jgi:hypothetical protein